MALLLSSVSFPFSSPRPSFSSHQSPTATLSSSSITRSFSVSVSARPPIVPVYCGRGDRKTKKGKRFIHSYGNSRPRDKTKGRGPARAATPINPYKKVDIEEDDDVDDQKDKNVRKKKNAPQKEDDN